MAAKKFYLLSLGCAKNLVDTENIAGTLCNEGWVLTTNLADADLAIINTCAFLKSARHESLQEIFRILRHKGKTGRRPLRVLVAGCLAAYYGEDSLKKMIPGVDHALSPGKYGSIPTYLYHTFHLSGKLSPDNRKGGVRRLITSSPHSVYLKIADGCDNCCAYCLIPALRGPLHSRKMEEILAEARALQKLGAREITLIAQDTTAYGLDLYGKKMLGELLQRLCTLDGLAWIRIMYTHPAHLDEGLLRIMAAEPTVCKYIDMPLQHIGNPILQRMGRGVTREQTITLYEKIRDIISKVALRTTIMVGYPGEGEKEFNELLAFLRDYPFERVGAFIFSAEQGTRAFAEKEQVPASTARTRYRQVMEQQAAISRRFNRLLLGEKHTVLVDTITGRGKYLARLSSQAPEVDGRVYVRGSKTCAPGELITVKVTGLGTYDLLASEESS